MVKRAGPKDVLAIIGKAAEDHLLQGAKFKRVDSSGYRLFEKKGRYQTALRDFNAVKPSDIIPTNLGRRNNIRIKMKVGDRKVQLRYNEIDVGDRRQPMILISNPVPGELPYKIIYKKKVN